MNMNMNTKMFCKFKHEYEYEYEYEHENVLQIQVHFEACLNCTNFSSEKIKHFASMKKSLQVYFT